MRAVFLKLRSVLTFSTHVQYTRSVLTFSTHVQYSRSVLTFSTHVQYTRSVLEHSTHVQYSRSVLTFSTHVQYTRSVLTCSTHAQYSSSVLKDVYSDVIHFKNGRLGLRASWRRYAASRAEHVETHWARSIRCTTTLKKTPFAQRDGVQNRTEFDELRHNT